MKRWTTQFKIKDKDFYNIDTLIDNLNDYADTLPNEIDAAEAKDAAYAAEVLSKYYSQYYDDAYYLKNEEDKYDRPMVTLGHSNNIYQGAPTLEVRKSSDGYYVLLSGKDILYQEYGTGLVGQKDGYPGNLPSDWDYASGEKIIQNHSYINSSNSNETIPKWYENALEAGSISESDAVWLSPRGITKGDHAGAFIWQTYDQLLDEADNPDRMNLKLGSRYQRLLFETKLTKGLK